MLKLIAPLRGKRTFQSENQDSDSEAENVSVARTSTPVKTTTTNFRITPRNSRNNRNTILRWKTFDCSLSDAFTFRCFVQILYRHIVYTSLLTSIDILYIHISNSTFCSALRKSLVRHTVSI